MLHRDEQARSGSKLAVITGGASGIGYALTREFLARDYSCLVLDKDACGLAELQGALQANPPATLTTLCLDVLEDGLAPTSEILRSFEAHTWHLVNNIGGSLGPRRDFEALRWNDFQAAFTFNLRATVLLTQALLPRMRAQRSGWIVNVASIAARAALDYVGADYAAAKAGVLALTRTLAKELATSGIFVNAVCPGIIATPRILDRWSARPAEVNRALLTGIPLGRLGTPDEVARACVFLGSSSNTYITGAVLDINGGAFLA